MPLIFASSLLGLPLALARLTDSAALEGAASALGPGGALYLPVNVALIAFFNYYYTFLQVCVEVWRLRGGRELLWATAVVLGSSFRQGL
jgi:preprotein translocase subunit SecY